MKIENSTNLSSIPHGHLFEGTDKYDYKLAEQYYDILNDPNQYVKAYNEANINEKDIKIDKPKKKRAQSSYMRIRSISTVGRVRPVNIYFSKEGVVVKDPEIKLKKTMNNDIMASSILKDSGGKTNEWETQNNLIIDTKYKNQK